MTVPATARRAGPYNGNGSTTSFSFSFKTFAAGDLQVTRTSSVGIETVLVLNSDYSVTLNPDQDTSPGGTITYPISGSALPTGSKLTIVGNLAYEQTTDLLGGGAFNARVIEDTFDRTVIQIQQLEERADRAMALPVSASGVSATLPAPEANKYLGWNGGATALVNRDGSDLITAAAYGNWRTDVFNGTGAQIAFILTQDPGNVNNTDVAIGGVTQTPGVDYTVSGTTLTFTSAPPAGTGNVVVRYGLAIPAGITDSNLVTFLQAGTGADPRTAQSKLRDIVDVKDFGVVGNGSADDTQALRDAVSSGAKKVIFNHGLNILISDTVTIPPNVDIDFNNSKVTYNGPRTKPAFIHGTANLVNRGRVDNIWIETPTPDWLNTNFVGWRAINYVYTHVNIRFIENFTIGFECYSIGNAYAHVTHILGAISTCKYGIALTCDGSGGPAPNYANENTFLGGDYTNQAPGGTLGECYGIWFRAINGGYVGHNGNRFYGFCFQPGDVVGVNRVPIFMDVAGNFNQFDAIRYESGNGPTMICKGGPGPSPSNDLVVGNVVRLLSYLNLVGLQSPTVSETGTARLNYVYNNNEPQSTEETVVFSDLTKLVKSYNTNDSAVMGGLNLFTNLSPTPTLYVTDTNVLRVLKNFVEVFGNNAIGFFVKVSAGESFVVFSETQAGFAGRPCVSVYDANFTQLTNASATFPDVRAGYSANYAPYGAAFGGHYNPQNDSNSFVFTVSSAVRFIRVFIGGGTNPARVRSFGIKRLTRSEIPMSFFSGIDTNATVHYASANPDTGSNGIFQRGDIAVNNTAAAGAASYWQCTTSGRLAPAWVGATAYTAGRLVFNDTNKIYECVTGGTSAGVGGPTGTGTGIVDGTCVWNYLAPKAVFRAGANL